ncbi:PIN domain-containing protein [Candidatus Gottesmanbacteria bacterium]|nr:PIN domain-containing protein [Candidatus Gottesmanbacteria bacterium]
MGRRLTFSEKLVKAKTIGLDSMVFIYLFEKNKKYFPLVEVIFDLLENKKISCVTSIISPLEVLSASNLSQDLERLSLYSRFFKEETNLTVVNLDLQIMETAAGLRRVFRIKTPDAIQLATAITKNAALFVTNDDSFKKIRNAKNLPEICILSSI